MIILSIIPKWRKVGIGSAVPIVGVECTSSLSNDPRHPAMDILI